MTMNNGLKIYACSGVGSGIGDPKYNFTYWVDNTDTTTNTKAVNNLLAFINSVNAEMIYTEQTEEELIAKCNAIDLYITCLQAAKSFHNEELKRAGRIIAIMVKEDFFNSQSLNDGERDTNLDGLISRFYQSMKSQDEYNVNTPFYDWFVTNVANYDYVGLSVEQQEKAKEYLQAENEKVGATSSGGNAVEKFVECGGYYLYLYFNEEERKKLPFWVQMKIKKELEVKKYVLGVYEQIASPEAMEENIRIGVMKNYGHTPEWMIEQINNSTKFETKKIGGPLSATVIVAIIEAVVTILTTLIPAIIGLCVSITQIKYQVPTNADSGIATGEDIEKMMQEETSKKQRSNYLKYGLFGLIALLLVKNKK